MCSLLQKVCQHECRGRVKNIHTDIRNIALGCLMWNSAMSHLCTWLYYTHFRGKQLLDTSWCNRNVYNIKIKKNCYRVEKQKKRWCSSWASDWMSFMLKCLLSMLTFCSNVICVTGLHQFCNNYWIQSVSWNVYMSHHRISCMNFQHKTVQSSWHMLLFFSFFFYTPLSSVGGTFFVIRS